MLISSGSDNTPEADMAGRRVDRLGMTRGGPIPPAIVGGAEMRATFQHLARDVETVARVRALLFRAAARVLRHTAGLGHVSRMAGGVPVGRPFPDIADHVVDAVAVGRKGAHRRGAGP